MYPKPFSLLAFKIGMVDVYQAPTWRWSKELNDVKDERCIDSKSVKVVRVVMPAQHSVS